MHAKEKYSIIIPIYNEASLLPKLLEELYLFYTKGNEIIIINDGSDDESASILESCNFIKLINLNKNTGKGFAIIYGLSIAKNNCIVIFDGDSCS